MTFSGQVMTLNEVKFSSDLSRSNYSSFDASRREEHDAGKSNVVALLSQKLLPEKKTNKSGYFWSLPSGG